MTLPGQITGVHTVGVPVTDQDRAIDFYVGSNHGNATSPWSGPRQSHIAVVDGWRAGWLCAYRSGRWGQQG